MPSSESFAAISHHLNQSINWSLNACSSVAALPPGNPDRLRSINAEESSRILSQLKIIEHLLRARHCAGSFTEL